MPTLCTSVTNRVGAIIRDARLRSGMTQRELAKRADITAVWLCNIEAGKCNPKLDTLQGIARALGMRLTISIEADK